MRNQDRFGDLWQLHLTFGITS